MRRIKIALGDLSHITKIMANESRVLESDNLNLTNMRCGQVLSSIYFNDILNIPH